MEMLYSYLIGFPLVRFSLSKSVDLFPQSFNPCFLRVCSVLGTLLHSLSSASLDPVIYSFIFMIRFHNTTFNTSGEDFPLEKTTPTENGSPKCLASDIKQGLSMNTL